MSEVSTKQLQEHLVAKFTAWSPPAPEVLNRTKRSITLDWGQLDPFHFIEDQLLFRLEKNDKIPPWVVVYRGGKTKKEIDNLAPRCPHKFKLKVIVKAEAVHTLAARAMLFYGDEDIVYEAMKKVNTDQEQKDNEVDEIKGRGDAPGVPTFVIDEVNGDEPKIGDDGDAGKTTRPSSSVKSGEHKWLESRWSEETWTSTDTDGTSVMCFCMAVRCGYMKQVQSMLEERPELIGILNPSNGYTPLATAVRRGDINTVRFLVCAGAEVDQRSATGQTPLHLAVLTARLPIIDLLLEKGADFQARDVNGLRMEHYAVDSCDVETLRYIMDKGGDVTVTDNNGWTPLFRALCQGANTAIVEELCVVRGSDVDLADNAGLPLTSVARIMTNRQGRSRDSVLRLVDMNYPHEIALANFTRLTKKIYNVHTLFKLPSLNKPTLKKCIVHVIRRAEDEALESETRARSLYPISTSSDTKCI
ncbi:ankyrin repeat and SAM domain-containing protein flippy [Anticarsia gemmatalis]|uniref:ankyrin repeat and SAM domain-containing protein flippy n=1 Tax=Anticarsia gemmatalis TaxID=129554 RepID=UPI003F766248